MTDTVTKTMTAAEKLEKRKAHYLALDVEGRRKAARNSHLPAEVLGALADDSEHSVRLSLASNPTTPVGVLVGFLDEDKKIFSVHTAGNPSLPVDVLVLLSVSEDENIRRAVARNTSTPVAVRDALVAAFGFNEDGFNILGFNADGWDRYDVMGYDDVGYALRSFTAFDERILPVNVVTGTPFDREGFSIYGFNRAGYDREGFTRYGDFNTGHVDCEGFDRDGVEVMPWNEIGFVARDRMWLEDGTHFKTGTFFDRRGFDSAGFNRDGFNRAGYDREGFNRDGWDSAGYARDGFNRDGWNRDRFNSETGTRYNSDGLSEGRLNRDGAKFVYGPERLVDIFGATATTPAELKRVTNVPSHAVDASKVKKNNTRYPYASYRNLAREGWVHEFTQGFNVDTALYTARLSFTHKDTGTHFNPEGFDVIGINEAGFSETGFDVKTKLHTVTGTKYGPDGWDFYRQTLAIGSLDSI